MDAAAEIGRNPGSKHQIRPEYRNAQADAGRNGRTRLARPNSQARTGTGKKNISPVQLRTGTGKKTSICVCLSFPTATAAVHLVQYICMYVYMVITYSKSMDKVDNPARGQLNRENECFLVPVRA